MEGKKGFGLSEEGEKKGGISGFLRRTIAYTAAAGIIFLSGAAVEYRMHSDISSRLNSYREIPAEQGPGDSITFRYDPSAHMFRKYIQESSSITEVGNDNLPLDNNETIKRLYSRGLEKEFFADAAQNAPGKYPKEFVLAITKQGMARYSGDIPVSSTVDTAWKSLLHKGCDAIESITCIDNAVE